MNECCGICKWHQVDEGIYGDWVCANSDSDNYADFTGFDDTCENWESREN